VFARRYRIATAKNCSVAKGMTMLALSRYPRITIECPRQKPPQMPRAQISGTSRVKT
jgi:hypothetical protein